MLVPTLATASLPVFVSLTSVHDDPFQDSVFVWVPPGFCPVEAKAAVVVPSGEPPKKALAVFKSVVSVQLEPFHDSLTAKGGGPYPP